MSDENISREELRRKLEATIKSLSQIVTELTLIEGSLKLQATKASVPKPSVSKPIQPPVDKLKEVMDAFPDDLADKLLFEENTQYIMIKTRQFLGAEDFRETLDTILSLGGEYISAGKASRFQVPK